MFGSDLICEHVMESSTGSGSDRVSVANKVGPITSLTQVATAPCTDLIAQIRALPPMSPNLPLRSLGYKLSAQRPPPNNPLPKESF